MRHGSFICPLCDRVVPDSHYIEKHHLVPRSRKGKETILVCVDCGNQVHELFTNKELELNYDTVEKIRSDPRWQKWRGWIGRKNQYGLCMKRKKKKR